MMEWQSKEVENLTIKELKNKWILLTNSIKKAINIARIVSVEQVYPNTLIMEALGNKDYEVVYIQVKDIYFKLKFEIIFTKMDYITLTSFIQLYSDSITLNYEMFPFMRT